MQYILSAVISKVCFTQKRNKMYKAHNISRMYKYYLAARLCVPIEYIDDLLFINPTYWKGKDRE